MKLRPLHLACAALLGASASAADAATILALDKANERLHLIDADAFTLRASVHVGQGPHEVIASADGTRAYVALYGDHEHVGHTLVEVDVAAAKVLRTIDTRPLLRPHGMARAGENIYFTAELNRAVGRFNPETGTVDRVLGVGKDGSHMIEIAPDGQQLFTADMGSGSISRIDFRVQQPTPSLTHYDVGERPEGLAIHPSGKEAWIGLGNGEGTVKVLDLDSGAIVATLPAGKQPARLELTPDGSRALTIDPTTSRLLVFDTATRTQRHAHTIEGLPLGMLPDADNARVVVTLVQTGQVAEIDIDTGKVLRSVDVGSVADGSRGRNRLVRAQGNCRTQRSQRRRERTQRRAIDRADRGIPAGILCVLASRPLRPLLLCLKRYLSRRRTPPPPPPPRPRG